MKATAKMQAKILSLTAFLCKQLGLYRAAKAYNT